MLIPPQKPNHSKIDSRAWNLVNHTPFNGVLDDCFRGTSLHLGFSGYEVPLDVGEHGGRFTEAFISAHDQGQWISDLDISRLFPEQCQGYEGFRVEKCEYPESCKPDGVKPSDWESYNYTSIESWSELLDAPCRAAVVRAHGNWQARFATTLVSSSMGRETLVVGCLPCYLTHQVRGYDTKKGTILVV